MCISLHSEMEEGYSSECILLSNQACDFSYYNWNADFSTVNLMTFVNSREALQLSELFERGPGPLCWSQFVLRAPEIFSEQPESHAWRICSTNYRYVLKKRLWNFGCSVIGGKILEVIIDVPNLSRFLNRKYFCESISRVPFVGLELSRAGIRV